MLSYDHQGGLGGVLTSLTSTSLTLRNMHTLHMLSYDHQGGRGDVLTSLRSTSVTLRNTHTLRMLSCDHQGGGGWGCINVFDEHFPYVTEHVHVAHAVVWSWGGLGGCINVFDEHFPDVTEQVYPKKYLGPTAGHGVTMSPCSLWLLRCHERSGTEASRRRKNWMSECRPDMIRMVENHRFLMFFDPWRAKSSHRAGETQIFTLEPHACQSKWMSMLQTFFDDSCKYQHFVS